MVTISYAITCHNELGELRRLLDQLLLYVRPEDEIVIQQDIPGDGSQEYVATRDLIELYADKYKSTIKVVNHQLNKDFAQFKNNIKNHCTKDYVFFIDADETLADGLISNLSDILEENKVDLFVIPRANTVKGLTENHIKQWGWRVQDGLVNWPDYQGRLIKNVDYLLWFGKVHERIVGYQTISQFPADTLDWCLHHDKDIIKQEKQNNLYNTI